jgi:hypothetical protein
MAMELLLFAPPHRAIHDAESLIYVLLFLCSHLDGPNSVGKPPLLGPGGVSKHLSGISAWLSATSLKSLGHVKFSMMTTHFSIAILPHLSPCFELLKPHICNLWAALFPSQDMSNQDASRSVATLRDLINAFKTVLLDEALIEAARAPGNHRKRLHPGELIMSGNGWDAVPAPKKAMVAKMHPKRRKSVLNKGRSR